MTDIELQPEPEPVGRISYAQLRQALQAIGFKVFKRSLQSANFEASVSGWRLTAEGNLEAVNVILSGQINATSGSIGGFVIGANTLTGGTLQTDTTGDRIVVSGPNNRIEFYDDSTLVGTISPIVGINAQGSEIFSYDNSNVVQSSIGVLWRESDGIGIIKIYADDADLAGIRMEYLPANGYATMNFQECVIQDLNDLDPEVDESSDLGNSSRKYDNIWCDTIHRTSESSPSDRDLKKNITDLDRGLIDVLALRPRKFKWKKTDKEGFGFIAQEVQSIVPEMVGPILDKENLPIREIVDVEIDDEGNQKVKIIKEEQRFGPDGKKLKRKIFEVKKENGESILSIDYALMYPMLVKSIQELNAIVEAQKVLLKKHGIV